MQKYCVVTTPRKGLDELTLAPDKHLRVMETPIWPKPLSLDGGRVPESVPRHQCGTDTEAIGRFYLKYLIKLSRLLRVIFRITYSGARPMCLNLPTTMHTCVPNAKGIQVSLLTTVWTGTSSAF